MSAASLEEDMRIAFPWLRESWKGVVEGGELEFHEISGEDHYYTDGAACGCSFKLRFQWPQDFIIDYRSSAVLAGRADTWIYMYPDGDWREFGTYEPHRQLRGVLSAWIRRVQEDLGLEAARRRTLERTALIKERLIAAAWSPARVAAALEAGKEMEDM